MINECVQFEPIIAMVFSFIGCSIRYGELYKTNHYKVSWHLIDSFISICLGYITYLEATKEFSISVTHTYLICIIVGNMGSKVLTYVKAILNNKLNKLNQIDISELTIQEKANDTKSITKSDKEQ